MCPRLAFRLARNFRPESAALLPFFSGFVITRAAELELPQPFSEPDSGAACCLLSWSLPIRVHTIALIGRDTSTEQPFADLYGRCPHCEHQVSTSNAEPLCAALMTRCQSGEDRRTLADVRSTVVRMVRSKVAHVRAPNALYFCRTAVLASLQTREVNGNAHSYLFCPKDCSCVAMMPGSPFCGVCTLVSQCNFRLEVWNRVQMRHQHGASSA